MAHEARTHSGDPHLVPVVVDGLRKGSRSKKTHSERVTLPESEPISALWAKLKSLNYEAPDWLQLGEKKWSNNDEKKLCVHPFEEIEVVQGRASENGKCINIDDPLIAFTNRFFGKEINLKIADSDSSNYGTAMQSLKYEPGLDISFHRTIRMPDDDKLHQLPGSLGAFPIYNVSAYAEHLPDNIVEQGGVFLPMWQREALWINFDAPYPQKYALRVFVGRINAVSGLKMDERVDEAQVPETLQDYVVVPGQEWLDGICVAPGIVRQFVAMPLGAGYTVEGQKTGEERFGGLQIEIIPSYERGLRTWQLEHTGQGGRTVVFDESKNLDERKTPSELRLNPGVKLRSYPSRPTYWAPYQISELIGTTPNEDIHLRAIYRETEVDDARSKRRYQSYSYSSAPSPASASAFSPRRTLGDRARDSEPRPIFGMPLGSTSAGAEYNYPSQGIPMASQRSRGPTWEEGGAPSIDLDAPTAPEDASNIQLVTKDLKSMGLAAGGKLVQDIYRDSNPAHTWNTEFTRLVNVHLLDPASCEKVTHIVPPPPPIDAMGYVEADMPFFVVEEQVDNRVDGGDFDNVISVSAMDKEKGVTVEPAFDPSKPKMCKECETRLCDCIVRPCDHQFCNVCIRKLENGNEASSQQIKKWTCPTCSSDVAHVAGFSAPMNLPGEEALKVKVSVHVLKIEDGRVQFKSIDKSRI